MSENDNRDVEKLIRGFAAFRKLYYEEEPDLYRNQLRYGQNPHIAMVACSDSRVDPAITLQTNPGDIFAIRNVAALIPPHEEGGQFHGTSAALEFAVKGLQVAHVVIMGHALCGGVANMVREENGEDAGGQFLSPWTGMLSDAYDYVREHDPDLQGEALARAYEQAGVRISLRNLQTFPFIREALAENRLQIHGWYLNIYDGSLSILNQEKDLFEDWSESFPLLSAQS